MSKQSQQVVIAPPMNVHLVSKIVSLSPTNLGSWAYCILGVVCNIHSQNLTAPLDLTHVVNCLIDQPTRNSVAYRDLQEFVTYIVDRQFDHPRLVHLSDLHPKHFLCLDSWRADLQIERVDISQNIIQPGPYDQVKMVLVNRTGYILTPKTGFKPTWILTVFDAISVVQVVRNCWGSETMEVLVRHLVRHGIEFQTLVAVPQSSNTVALNLMNTLPTLPIINNRPFNGADYRQYTEIRNSLVHSPQGKAAFRAGGILWRLAMESEGDFDDIIKGILNGPSDTAKVQGNFFVVNGVQYFDDMVSMIVADTICGAYQPHGPKCK